MTKKVLITQSNYIPWKGYFDAINMADNLVLYDDMQYTKRDWRNRNQIKTPQGPKWLSVPVLVKGKFDQKINETLIGEENWGRQHYESIKHAYSKAPFWQQYRPMLEELYLNNEDSHLSIVNERFLKAFSKELGIVNTAFSWSSDFELRGDKTEKLLNICLDLQATHYITGPAAKNYMEVELFEKAGIEIIWMDYSDYPEYEQLYPPFTHAVSVLDLLLMQGPEAPKFMKSF